MEQIEPRILKKFDILQKLGKGAYGVVWKAIHRKSGQVVALKKVFDAFQNATDAQRTYREVMLLKGLKGNPNIITLLGVLKAENNRDIYLIFEFMETDMHVAIRANLLEQVHKRYIIYQIAKALKYIHSADVVHRDLKPSNILLDTSCTVKVADFGLARSLTQSSGSENVLTQHIATRWYRAPEILLGSTSYTKSVDMWSLGCIMAELLTGKPLFSGSSTLNQLEKIVELLGFPTRQDVYFLQSPLIMDILGQIHANKIKKFSVIFSQAPKDALDLIRRLLVYNPTKRMTAEEVLSHPYLRQFSEPKQQKICQVPIDVGTDDNIKYSVRFYRQVLYSMDKQKQSPCKRNEGLRSICPNTMVVTNYQSKSREKLHKSPSWVETKHNKSVTKCQSHTKSYTKYCQNTPQKLNKLYTQSTCSRSSNKIDKSLTKSYSRKFL